MHIDSEATVTQLWLTVDDAADVLNVSSSTVRRRIKADKLESRLNDDGVTEVRVETDDDDAAASADPAGELRARRQLDNTDDQLRANPWVRATRPGDALMADRRVEQDRQAAASSAPPHEAEDEDKDEDDATSPAASDDAIDPEQAQAVREELEAAGRDFRPSDVESGEGDALARFQKLAGASVLLAQRQADDAREQVAVARHESYRLRRLCYASWVASAALLLICFGLCLSFALAASNASARADVAEQALAEQRTQQNAFAESTTATLERLARQADAAADPVASDGQAVSVDRFTPSTTADVREAPFRR
jgi:hypothetical protein